MTGIDLNGTTGIWSGELRYGEPGPVVEAAAELETLGYTAVWVPDIGGDLFGSLELLLGATEQLTVASGILNLWMHTPVESAEAYARLTAAHGDRLLFGIGVSHAPLVDAAEAGRYRKPLTAMIEFLDGLDVAATPVPVERRLLGALGPKMLEVARARTAGVHPYNATPEHTALAREAVGRHALVCPEMAVVLETDPGLARAAGRRHLLGYLGLPNYANNLLRLGFDAADLTDGGSNRLVDALVAWGDEEAIRTRVDEHRDAGADHVCIQALDTSGLGAPPVEQWRRLAPALVG